MPETKEEAPSQALPSKAMEVDFAIVVSRMVDAAKNDPAQMRSAIYELARRTLKEQFTHEDAREAGRMIQALETAIHGVEAFSRRQEQKAERPAALSAPPSEAGGTARGQPLVPEAEVISEPQPLREDDLTAPLERPKESPRGFSYRRQSDPHPPAVIVVETVSPPASARLSRMPLHSGPRKFIPLRALFAIGTLAMLFSGGVYLHRYHDGLSRLLSGGSPEQADQSSSVTATPTAGAPTGNVAASDRLASTTPIELKNPLLPTTYGVYAVSNDQLFEIHPLPGHVPDIRIAVSAAINVPSQTAVPDGRLRFIVYRHDSIGNVPDRAELRVVAKVMRAMTFDQAGKPQLAQAADDSWVIRNISFNYRVGPVKDDPDMYQIVNEDDNFTLPPGRYALVINGIGYDFTVSGQVTDPHQCLERVEATNGSFYSECRSPG